jgi:hypothetical protein
VRALAERSREFNDYCDGDGASLHHQSVAFDADAGASGRSVEFLFLIVP